MKLFRVVYEEEGRRITAPGISETDMRHCELRYAARTMQEVWSEIAWLLTDSERNVLAIIEDAPMISVIGKTPLRKRTSHK